MGNCAISPQSTKQHGVTSDRLHHLRRQIIAYTAKIIHLDGSLQELREPIKARQILSQNPNCFLCNSESMFIGSQVPHLSEEEELQLGQIYFLMPLSKSQTPLTLHDLCSLAIKASSALPNGVNKYPATTTPQGFHEIPIGFQGPAKAIRSNQRIKL